VNLILSILFTIVIILCTARIMWLCVNAMLENYNAGDFFLVSVFLIALVLSFVLGCACFLLLWIM
jgi:hypothetical protein